MKDTQTHPQVRSSVALVTALLASLFFSFTFVLNRKVMVEGGHWQWAASLRYVVTFVALGILVAIRDGFGELPTEIRAHWRPWVLWSVIGLGVFASLITWAASSGPAWLVAGGFQLTVIAGPLQAPWIYKDGRRRIPFAAIVAGIVVVAGVVAMQWDRAKNTALAAALLPALAVALSACLYPLGNRKLLVHLEECGTPLKTTQRVWGMTMLSLLLFIPMALWTWWSVGPPTRAEWLLGLAVGITSGLIATVLLFGATEKMQHNPTGLAAVEAMQAGAVIFSMLMGGVFLGDPWPRGLAAVGAALVIAGIILFSYLSYRARRT